MNSTVHDGNDYRLERWQNYPPFPRSACILLAVVMIISLTVGAVGNTVVLALFAKYKSLRTPANVLVINLTVTDLLMCILCLPMLTVNCIRGHFDRGLEKYLCHFDAFMGALMGFVSIWSLTALAVDRCIVILRSERLYHSDGKSINYCTIASIWFISAAGASLPFFGVGKYVMDGSNITCTFDFFTRTTLNMSYNIVIQVFYFYIPVACISMSYFVIFILVRKHERRYFDIRKNGKCDEMSLRRMCRCRKQEKNEIKTARIGITLIIVFCLTWAPYSIVAWIGLFGKSSELTPLTVTLPGMFAKLFTTFNPILYALLQRSFKAKLALFYRVHFKSSPALSHPQSDITHSYSVRFERVTSFNLKAY